MSKSAAIALAILMSTGIVASHADTLASINGATARQMCKTDSAGAFGFVVGIETAAVYLADLAGLHEGLSSYKDGVKTPIADTIKGQICIPENIAIADRVGLFCKYLELNHDQETDNYSAFAAYAKATMDMCGK